MIAIDGPAAYRTAFALDEFSIGLGPGIGIGMRRGFKAICGGGIGEGIDQYIHLDFHWGYANGMHRFLFAVD